MTRPPHITEERIRERAYRLWIEEGQPQGKDAEHWEEARELLALEADPEEAIEERGDGYNNPGPWEQGEQKVPNKRPTASKRRPKIARKRPVQMKDPAG